LNCQNTNYSALLVLLVVLLAVPGFGIGKNSWDRWIAIPTSDSFPSD